MKIQVDVDVCRGCEACALACSLVHEGVSNPLLSRVLVKKDMAHYRFNLVICEQCHEEGKTPECIQACPTEAIRLDERNVVMIYDDECLRCGACAEACPYHAIFFNQSTDQYYKCDLCAGLKTADGKSSGPACVEICPVDALTLRLEAIPQGGAQ